MPHTGVTANKFLYHTLLAAREYNEKIILCCSRQGFDEPQPARRDYNELCKTEGEHPPTVSNLPFPWHVMTSAPFQATPLPDLDMDAFRAHL